jgi:hypothetical protein
MIERLERIQRAPIGFIVEGEGEFYCYPSLVCRVLDKRGLYCPVVNAGGYGNIIRHLDDQLTSLTLRCNPCNVIVTVDLKDALDRGLCNDCADLRVCLEQQACNWLLAAMRDSRLAPLPDRIKIVIQVPKFESWVIADVDHLCSSGHIAITEYQLPDVDSQIANPAQWLKERLAPRVSLKNPKHAKEMISKLDPNVMRQNSASFDKFCRETTACYTLWCHQCGLL